MYWDPLSFWESEDKHLMEQFSRVCLLTSRIFLLFLANQFGIVGLMIVVVIGSFHNGLVKYPAAHKLGYRSFFRVFDIKDKYTQYAGTVVSYSVLLGVGRSNDLECQPLIRHWPQLTG